MHACLLACPRSLLDTLKSSMKTLWRKTSIHEKFRCVTTVYYARPALQLAARPAPAQGTRQRRPRPCAARPAAPRAAPPGASRGRPAPPARRPRLTTATQIGGGKSGKFVLYTGLSSSECVIYTAFLSNGAVYTISPTFNRAVL